jgi:FkbM family methyltransferase
MTTSSEVLGTVVETRQGFFCLDPQDQFVSKALLERGEYGLGEIGLLAPFLKPSSKVLLVGTHIGALLVPLAKRVESIVGVEANPRTYRMLRLNLLMNQCANVRTFNLAASDTSDSIEFVMNKANSGASKRMPLNKADIYFQDNPDVVRVPSARLDDLLPHESFDLVFMDIEGSELFAMRGMPRILSTAKVVVSEFYPFMVRDVAGAGAAEFLEPLADFNTLVVPSLRRAVHREAFHETLREMFDKNHCDNGIFFVRDRIEAKFAA